MANTNSGSKFYICTTPQSKDLTQSEFEALTWLEVKNIGQLPESGSTTNIVNYDTIDTTVTQKAKGMTDAGSGTLELALVSSDESYLALVKAARSNYNYAFKRELADAPSATMTNTVLYNRGLITGPATSGAGVEDFVTATFTFGYNQQEIVVAPKAISA
ncbi:hypothetical protein N5853_11135 [Bartonella sp. HY329]|uniref:hypothetical protein n=1 Tax=unclassified Bartonella TaxID=2645622 RepID=UPI0021C9C90E|nr:MULTISPECIES: hypothetical protein [unclassified Bartonella]UXM94646.1 hypothetical protein N5853_11135 [Bartonella sp. HY329]UXN08969.1 hypothetical protein N5852_11145 [Bartonella sp. HY328]